MALNPPRFDAVARRVINEWMIGFSVETPAIRAEALRTIADIANELADKAELESSA